MHVSRTGVRWTLVRDAPAQDDTVRVAPLRAPLRAHRAGPTRPVSAWRPLPSGAARVAGLATRGQRSALDPQRFAFSALEGCLYAVLMRFAGSYVVGSLRLAPGGGDQGVLGSVVMALGAGFYEEVAFRVGLFGVGAALLRKFVPGTRALVLTVCWGLLEAAAFPAGPYPGAPGDGF